MPPALGKLHDRSFAAPALADLETGRDDAAFPERIASMDFQTEYAHACQTFERGTQFLPNAIDRLQTELGQQLGMPAILLCPVFPTATRAIKTCGPQEALEFDTTAGHWRFAIAIPVGGFNGTQVQVRLDVRY